MWAVYWFVCVRIHLRLHLCDVGVMATQFVWLCCYKSCVALVSLHLLLLVNCDLYSMTDLSDNSVDLPINEVVSSRIACCELSDSFASSVSSSCSSLSSDDSIVGTPIKKTVNVYCPNKHWGCQWDGSLDGISAHIVNDCQFVEVTCGECHRRLPCSILNEHHDSNCTKLPVSLLRTAH